MDRIDAMRVFIAALDEGSLAGAGRQLGRSPAAVSRAVAFLEQQVGATLLHRTTRAIRLSEIGERYAAACRRVLAELHEAEAVGAGERVTPRGTLTITAPPISGEEILQPTAITNLFTGRPARGVVNRLMAELGPLSDFAPAFPTAGTALGPLRNAAEAAGRDGFSPLWAGQAFPLAKPMSAAALTRFLAAADN